MRHYDKWRTRWIDGNGERRSETHDDFKTAAYKLREHELHAEEVRRGLRRAAPPDKSCSELFDYWLEKRAPLKRSEDNDKSIIRRHLRPAFGKLRVRELTAEHADDYVIAHAEFGKKTVANHLTLLVSTLNVARDLGWLDRVPRIHKPRVRIHGKDFAYLRSQGDIRRFLDAAAAEGEAALAIFATAVFTGARAGELAALTWSDIDFDRRLITTQRSFDGPTKADDVRHVPILDPLLPILRAWRLRNPLPIAFPNQAGTMLGESSRIFQEVFHAVLKIPIRRTD